MDASVVVKWFVPEEKQLEARALLLSEELLGAPATVVAEVATAISRKVRVERLPEMSARHALEAWLEMLTPVGRIKVEQDRALLREAMKISIELDHQLPDCLYVALARREGCPLVTADGQLVKKAKGLKGVEVRLL